MLFSSIIFLFYFLPVVLIGSLLIKGNKWRNLFLLFASLFFFAWGETEMIFLLMASLFANYYFAIVIDKQTVQSKRKFFLWISVLFNVGLLGYYKYANFFVDNINHVFNTSLALEKIALPIGISFYTFHNISYIIDVYKRKIAAQPDLVNIALYISFFPQLIAGPIVRYVDIADQLYHRVITSELFASGVKRFIIGLAKKVIIANAFAFIADDIFNLASKEWNMASTWVGAIAYSIQIYFDFSGYSDMAIGLGRMFGFRFLENFNFPYSATSIQDFWRRWHISLSSWFKDYVYIPLGGNQVKPFKLYLNLSIVFLLTGFWHGASWNFIIWGAIHGLFLIIERIGLNELLKKIPVVFSRIYMLLVVVTAWVFFRLEDFSRARNFISIMYGGGSSEEPSFSFYRYFDSYTLILLFAAILFSASHRHWLNRLNDWLAQKNNPFVVPIYSYGVIVLYAGLFIYTLLQIAGNTYNPFIYFRF